MADRIGWRRRAVATIAALALAAVAGCGVPSSGPPVVVGPAPAGTNPGDQNPNSEIKSPDSYTLNEKLEFVNGYLSAAVEAAARSDDPSQPAGVQASFLGPDVKKPVYVAGSNVSITLYGIPENTRLESDTLDPADPEAATFKLNVVRIGTFLPASGTVIPDASGTRVTLRFTVAWTRPNADTPHPPALRIVRSSLHDGSLIATDLAMKQSFQPHYIYWWNKTHKGVVPDLRYIAPQAPVRAATDIVNWVLNEPVPSWIASAVDRVVPGATLADTFVGVGADDRFTVNLTAGAAGSKPLLPLLATQLRMSIGKITPKGTDPAPVPLEILVGGQSQVTDAGNDWRTRALNFPAPHTGAKAYAIVDGKVRPIDIRKNEVVTAKDAELPSALATTDNANVIYAAVDRTQGNAAFVKRAADGKETLSIVRAGASTTPKALSNGRSFIRPQWLDSSGKLLLVGVDGKLYTVDSANKAAHVANASTTTISAFAVAPDGERIAFVANGKLYLAVLDLSGEPALTTPVQINVSGSLGKVTAVSWGPSEVSLLVGGVSSLIVMDLYGLSPARAFVGTEAVPQPVDALASVPYDLFGTQSDAGQMGPMMAAGGRMYTSAGISGPVSDLQPKGMSSPFFGD